MSAQVDVAGPIAAIRRRAEREFDQKILALAPVVQRAAGDVRVVAPGAYQWGVLSAAMQEAAEALARAFAQGQSDWRNRG